MKHREVRQAAQGHIVNKCQSQDINPSHLTPQSMCLTILLYCLRYDSDYCGGGGQGELFLSLYAELFLELRNNFTSKNNFYW